MGRHNKKNLLVPKKGFPIEPRYAGMCMLLPIWLQTLFRNGDCPYGKFLSLCLFRLGDSPYGYGDCCFHLPLSHGCAGAPPKILAKKPKFPALPMRAPNPTGIHKSPYQNGDSPFPYGD